MSEFRSESSQKLFKDNISNLAQKYESANLTPTIEKHSINSDFSDQFLISYTKIIKNNFIYVLLGTITSLEPLELISVTIPACSIVSISLAALL